MDQQFAYNTFQFQETLVTQWNMVCDQEYKVTGLGSTLAQVALVISVYMAGFLIGSFACGWLGDKIGEVSLNLTFARQKEVFDGFSSALLNIFFGWNLHAGTCLLRCNQVNPLVVQQLLRFLTAIGVIGVMLMAFTMTVEVVGVK